ncbi:hypothetical protein, partial [Mesorhizobium salmacidum]|uniref:hypothetical protein n=1 Tax=Mesorhizobium salmacidum TaxID=3015171 RepID=UPI00301C2889
MADLGTKAFGPFSAWPHSKALFAFKEQHRTGRRTRFGQYKTGRGRYLGQQEINSRHDTLGG